MFLSPCFSKECSVLSLLIIRHLSRNILLIVSTTFPLFTLFTSSLLSMSMSSLYTIHSGRIVLDIVAYNCSRLGAFSFIAALKLLSESSRYMLNRITLVPYLCRELLLMAKPLVLTFQGLISTAVFERRTLIILYISSSKLVLKNWSRDSLLHQMLIRHTSKLTF